MAIDRLGWKRRLAHLAGRWRTGGPRRQVLLYHAVEGGEWALTGRLFRAQMEWLAAQTLALPLDALLEGPASTRPGVAITFDDGYACLVETALPILADLGLTATVYLNTGWIGDRERRPSDPSLGHYPGEEYMRWADVELLAAAGWTIGSHGVEHLDLTRTPDAVTDQELSESRQTIEMRLGLPCRHFSYTWGRHTPALRRRVAAAGYRYAAAGHHAPLSAGDDPLAFPRINIDHRYSLADYQAILRGDWDYLGWVQRARAWRG